VSVDDSESHANSPKNTVYRSMLADKTTETAARYGALMNLAL